MELLSIVSQSMSNDDTIFTENQNKIIKRPPMNYTVFIQRKHSITAWMCQTIEVVNVNRFIFKSQYMIAKPEVRNLLCFAIPLQQ